MHSSSPEKSLFCYTSFAKPACWWNLSKGKPSCGHSLSGFSSPAARTGVRMACGLYFPYEMREPFFAQLRCIFKAFVAECCQFLGSDRTVVQDESCHGPAAGLGPDGLHLQSAIFLADIEEGVDDSVDRWMRMPSSAWMLSIRTWVSLSFQNWLTGLS